jgi:outer membrane lipoprotein LolB
MRLRFTFLLWSLALFLLSGCASDAAIKLTQRSNMSDAPFTLNGRVAVKHDEGRSSANLRWVHNQNDDEILLLAPLGQTMARIHRDAQEVTLDAAGKHHVAQDVEALTRQVLGWELPLAGLRYWVTGVPAPESAGEVRRNENGQIAVLHQDGWEIIYSRYVTPSADSLPARLTLRREGLEITMLIDEWEKQ